jgi:hypothetical protein
VTQTVSRRAEPSEAEVMLRVAFYRSTAGLIPYQTKRQSQSSTSIWTRRESASSGCLVRARDHFSTVLDGQQVGASAETRDGRDLTPGSSHDPVRLTFGDPAAVQAGAAFEDWYGGVIGRGAVDHLESENRTWVPIALALARQTRDSDSVGSPSTVALV